MPTIIDTNGTPPLLTGKRCEAFVCEGFCFDGYVEETACVTYLKFDGDWTRLYFELGVIFWRTVPPTYTQFSDAEHTAAFPNTDVGVLASVIGEQLLNYSVQPIERDGCHVHFAFKNGRCIEVVFDGEFTNYGVT